MARATDQARAATAAIRRAMGEANPASPKPAKPVTSGGGGRLTTSARKALPGSAFALPGRRYPIPDESHARNALSRVSQYGSPSEKSKVRAAVHRRYPGIGRGSA
jgi:hypothetical protein